MRDGDSREEPGIAVSRILEQGLTALALSPSPEQIQDLCRLVLLLDQWAGRINLTGHRTPEQMARGLVMDAAALATVLPEIVSAEDIADLGTGAGFPGLPLAILFPGRRFHLVDARKKRHHFQREIRRRLDLAHVHPILGRSEALEPVPCDLVLAQAMAEPARALELMAQWARPGALLALPGSETAAPPPPPPGYSAPELRSYSVPESQSQRRLWILRPLR